MEQPSWDAPDALPVYAVTLNAEGRVDADSVGSNRRWTRSRRSWRRPVRMG